MRVSCCRRGFVLALLVLMLPALLGVEPIVDSKQKDGKLKVGTQTLTECKEYPQLWCGKLNVPLDRDDPSAGKIAIGFAWRPAERRSRGTIVANEGGPGYPSIASFTLWRGMFGPLLKDHDLLMVDARGTGMSRAIDCKGLQNFDGSQSAEAFHKVIADCGKQLNTTFKRGNGEYVHASDLFGTVDAVDDMAAVIKALKVGKVHLYGDSYGSFFAQAFAARHPEMLRSLTLDGTWPLIDANPWYPETPETLRFAFDAVCQRSAACRDVAPGSATARLGELAGALEAEPISGKVPRSGKPPIDVTVKGSDIPAFAWSAGSDAGIYRDLDAAGRAAMDGDPKPLLRLAARAGLNGTLSGGWPLKWYSVGHAVAVPCTDYPQIYDMSATPQERRQQFDAAAADLPAGFFAPFSVQQWLQNPIQDYDQCVAWPSPTHERELAPEGLPLVPSTLPVLILAGDLDSVTAMGGAETARDQLGPSARLVVVESSTHVVAQGDVVGCGSSLVRNFLRDPSHLEQLDTSCADNFPEIRATGVFPLELADQPLPTATAGNRATPEQQRLAALAVATAGDVIAYPPNRGKKLTGLRGGTIAASRSRKPRVLTLKNVRFAEDVAVSGKVKVPSKASQTISANLVAVADDGTRVKITASWRPLQPGALATVRGTVANGQTPLRISMPAP